MQRIISTFITCCICLLVLTASAQKNEFQKFYEQGKNELKNKNFDKAADFFKKAAADNPANAQRVNAMYFYAYCALKTKQYWSASHYLSKITSKYADWNKISEVYYLQAQMAFEKREYAAGVALTQKIRSKFLQKDVDNMKWNFLFYPSLQDTVTAIQQRYSSDTCLASILFKLLEDETGFKAKKLKKSLSKSFGFESQKEETAVERPMIVTAPQPVKDTLNIAVILPFNLYGNVSDYSIKNEHYVYDLYSGIRLAVDSLVKTGSKIRLKAYDYGQDSAAFYTLIDKPEMTRFDVLIGPLHNAYASKTAAFATKNKILVINPLSTNPKFTEESSLTYLFQPTSETQTAEAALFAIQNLKPKKALVISGKNVKDSALAVLFEKKFEAAGGKVHGRHVLSAGTLPKLGSIFNSKVLDSTGCIFVSTKDQYLSVGVVRKLTELNKTTPLLVFSEWLEFPSVTYEQMLKQKVHFILPENMSTIDDSTQKLASYFQTKTNSLPSQYTFTGFELLIELGMLAKNQPSFLSQPTLNGVVLQPGGGLQGMNYTGGRDNKTVSIYKFDENGFLKVK